MLRMSDDKDLPESRGIGTILNTEGVAAGVQLSGSVENEQVDSGTLEGLGVRHNDGLEVRPTEVEGATVALCREELGVRVLVRLVGAKFRVLFLGARFGIRVLFRALGFGVRVLLRCGVRVLLR